MQMKSIPYKILLSSQAMHKADQLTIDYGIPSFTLMETAGRAASNYLIEYYGDVCNKKAVILCGKGNNGGDGLVLARSLYAQGAEVMVLLISLEHLTSDTEKNYVLLQKLQQHDKEKIKIIYLENIQQLYNLPNADFYIDALLGTGLNKTIESPLKDYINWLNSKKNIIALDIPSGLSADSIDIPDTFVKADLTITMAALKISMAYAQLKPYLGEVKIAEIGIPKFILQQVMDKHCAYQTIIQTIAYLLPQRPFNAHKYSIGYAMVIAGSYGFIGAAEMSAKACAKIGAGGVICASDAENYAILASKFTEIMTLALSSSIDNRIKSIQEKKFKALLIGCGLGRNAFTQDFIYQVLKTIKTPMVIDADALYALINHTDIIQQYSHNNWLLTPHFAEFDRLITETLTEYNHICLARQYAQKWHCTIVLKGSPSIIACSSGAVFINPTGNSALASAGTGDILAGLCVGLIAQGLTCEEAAICAVYIGGLCAERYVDKWQDKSFEAMDILEELKEVLKLEVVG